MIIHVDTDHPTRILDVYYAAPIRVVQLDGFELEGFYDGWSTEKPTGFFIKLASGEFTFIEEDDIKEIWV